MMDQLSYYYDKLTTTESADEVAKVLEDLESNFGNRLTWTPIGGKANNSGPIEVSRDQGRALIERVTNAIDAVLEKKHDEHNGIPICKSPKEAANAWFGIPSEKGLSAITPAQRREIAKQNLVIRILPGIDKSSRVVEVIDNGIGISAEDMQKTILSLNESNKITKLYLSGTYGQGGSSTFAVSKFTLIASKLRNTNKVAFSVVKYIDLPPEEYKTGYYGYFLIDSKIPEIDSQRIERYENGTLVKHYGFQLDKYSNPVGNNSVYGLLNRMLFDPIIPLWLENRVNDYNRVIKGSRNSLNGAIDEDDENDKQPVRLSYHMDMFYVKISDFGQVGIEFWVLRENDGPKAYVNPTYPILLTLNGQNHGEFGRGLIKNETHLPYLANRLIIHVDCDRLTSEAKRKLFVSTREGSRGGIVEDRIKNEIVETLKSDDRLSELNEEAAQRAIYERSEKDEKIIRKEVARILNMQGVPVDEGLTSGSTKPGTGDNNRGGNKHHIVKSIDIRDPPTYIKILWEDPPIKFYPDKRRYIRIETDAPSHYFDATDPSKSRINIIVEGEGFINLGATPLNNGRMRIVVGASKTSAIGAKGKIRVELARTGYSVLFDEKDTEIFNPPATSTKVGTITLPRFTPVPIDRQDEQWKVLDWPEDITEVATETMPEKDGSLTIYYSTEFPPFRTAKESLERQRIDLGQIYTKRYEIWICAYALLYKRDETDNAMSIGQLDDLDEETLEMLERKEKCRAATMAVQFARREVDLLKEASVPSS